MTIYEEAVEIETTADQWWFVFDSETLTVVVPPRQCSGKTFTPLSFCVADSYEECLGYIRANGLTMADELFSFENEPSPQS
jgi:hypothetical protein